jgi:N-carbamoylputrescine amidase
MERHLTVAAIQMAFTRDVADNHDRAAHWVREAAAGGAQVILLPELFSNWYFCQWETAEWFDHAYPVDQSPAVRCAQELARELQVCLPTSFFERDGPLYYNSLAWVDARGEVAGVYRKSHIPDGPGYEEKFYFRPGNTGFRVWDGPAQTRVGVGICWDQWFPETARALMLQGAELLFYPTAIGSEPQNPSLETKDLWQRAMIGHAVSNVVPVIAANRMGEENGQTYYGHTFISDHRGNRVAELGAGEEGWIKASFDLGQIARDRAEFGFFRDRRPELYGALSTS